MKVLFLSTAGGPDYQCDMLYHGLDDLLGDDVVDVHRLWYMYREDVPDGSDAKHSIYGRGFTLYGLIDRPKHVDRDDVRRQIHHRHFDFVIYGNVRRGWEYLEDVLDRYPPDRIAFIDGEDDTSTAFWLKGRGLYFKRELAETDRRLLPIGFAIPEERVRREPVAKTEPRAFIDPRDRSTYIYDTEAGYYQDYARSLFAITMKKAGWDCLRHYEIIANQCMPDFIDLEHCPAQTMVSLPKNLIVNMSRAVGARGAESFMSGAGWDQWQDAQAVLQGILRAELTTRSLARRVLDALIGASGGSRWSRAGGAVGGRS